MVHTVMIVDDENEIRQAMIELVDWEDLGYACIGDAANGNDALEMIVKTPPDVLITDIKMPFLSGIELAKKVREISPLTKLIFLTGFSEFEYAKSAIKLNVVDYLLKPVSLEELSQVLKELKKALVNEKEQATNFPDMQIGYREELDVLKNAFLISLLVDDDKLDVPEEEIKQQVAHYHVNVTGTVHLVLVIRLDVSNFYQRFSDQELALSEYSLRHKIKQIVSKYVEGEIFSFSRNIVGILSDRDEQIGLFKDIIVKEIQESANQLYNMSLKIGISQEFRQLTQAKLAFEEAVAALNFPKYIPLHTKGTASVQNTTQRYPLETHIEKKIQFLVLSQEQEKLTRLLDELLHVSYLQSKAMFHLVIDHLTVIIQRMILTSGNSEWQQQKRQDLKPSDSTAEEGEEEFLREQIIAEFVLLQTFMANHQQTATVVIGQQAYHYLLEHFHEAALSLTTVANHFAISPSYFSTIFKQTNQQSFTDALTQIRMEKAQELLLSTTDRIMEIANQIGFIDQHYFSYAYKKYFGSSPKATRLKLKESH